MVMQINGGEGGTGTVTTNGTTVPAGSGETAMIVAVGGGSLVYTTADKVHGTQSFRLDPAANQILSLKSWALGNALSGAADFYFKTATQNPATADAIMQVRSNSGNLLTISRLAAGGLRVGGSANQDYTGFSFNPTTWKRLGIAWNIDATTPANSTYRLACFGVDSDTLLFDSGVQTITPTTTGVGADNVGFGRIGGAIADTTSVFLDDCRVETLPTGVTSDLIPTLGSLLPTAVINPTTADVGASPQVTVSATRGNANAKEYAIRIEFSANGNFTDTTVFQDFPAAGAAWSSSATFNFTPQTKGSYRVIPRVRQQPVG